MNNIKNISGKKFGSFTVLRNVRVDSGKRKRNFWECVCDCGNIKMLRKEHLVLKKHEICTCYKRVIYKTIGRDGSYKYNRANNIKNKKPISDETLYKRYSYSAKSRGLSFDITFGLFSKLIHSNCFYCGGLPNTGFINLYNGIDRKDNKVGYEEYNCLTCCKDCNYFKSNIHYDKFLELINKIATNLGMNTQINTN